ncbi:hypothetical protein GCM10022237_00350 [Nocardioides ginsengisoli]
MRSTFARIAEHPWPAAESYDYRNLAPEMLRARAEGNVRAARTSVAAFRTGPNASAATSASSWGLTALPTKLCTREVIEITRYEYFGANEQFIRDGCAGCSGPLRLDLPRTQGFGWIAANKRGEVDLLGVRQA